MACARDGPFDTGIHSLETNGTRIDTPIRQPMYSTSLFSPVPKRLVTITCSIQTPGGIVAKKPQHAQNNQRSQQGKQGQQQKRGGKAQVAAAPATRAAHTPTAPARPWRPGRDKFLPVSRADMDARGWDQCDFVYICGDAYVDHPSFGMAIISRVLDAHGYKVGIICQPDWTDPASITVLGEPRLGFLVSAGNMDSMVNHYSVTKHRRHTDAYTPGGEEGRRPNRAVTVYGNLIRQTFKDAPIIIGGIEASLRRLAHYDYWQDKLKRSVLLDSGADILIYGMGEHAIVEIADALDAGLPIDQITYINGTVYRTSSLDEVYDYDLLPSWDDLAADKLNYARSFNVQQQNMDPITGHRLVEPYPNSVYVVQNPPSATLTTDEMDEVAELPYARDWHPDYDAAGGVPAFAEIKFSISSNRGCFGECSFCALTFHQGRVLQMRSHDSIMREAELLTRDPEFKGYINDVGGPTANFSRPACDKQLKHGVCKNKRCLWPSVCKNMVVDESGYTQLLRDLRQLPGVKKVFVRSGIRFDYTMADASDEFLRELLEHHVSGQLRVAPEHVSDAVLSVMGKPSRAVYDAFCRKFERLNREYGLKQYVVPYLISSHPGSTMKEAVHHVDLHVLPRRGPTHHEADLRGTRPAREGHAACAHPIPQARELQARTRGTRKGRPPRSDWLHQALPDSPRAATPGRGIGQRRTRHW